MKYLLTAWLCINVFYSFGQEERIDSLVQLPEVEINANQNEGLIAVKEAIVDKELLATYGSRSVADILSSEGLNFVKSYGAGSIATASIRGGAAGQMAVFWNDLPIQSPMLGLVDLSILSSTGIDEIKLTKGGQSAELGAGAISGTIQIKSDQPNAGFQWATNTIIGSFAQQNQSISFSGGGAKWRFNSNFHKNTAEHNFPYQIREDLPIKYLAHAGTWQSGFEHSLSVQFLPKHSIRLNYWSQESFRMIPPTTVQTRSEAMQGDAFDRYSIHYSGRSKRAVLKAQLAYFDEGILYEDPQILLRAPSEFDSYIAQFSMERSLHEWRSKTNVQLMYFTATANEYSQQQTQSQVAIHQSVSRNITEKTNLILSNRLVFVSQIDQPIYAFNLKIESDISQRMAGFIRFSRDFRVPTLNDLYWIPGGNIDLQTEYSLGQEIGGVYQLQKDNRKKLTYSLNLFNRNVDNWIQWTQSDNPGFWSVNNITKVWSRGVEQEIRSTFQSYKTTIETLLKIDWIKSTYEESIVNPSVEKGESLWYVPKWQAFTMIKVSKKNWSASYDHRWVGATIGINDNLDKYHLGRLLVQFQHTTKNNNIQLFARCTNIWNTNYRVIERRPMPGRAFEIGLKLNGYK